MLAHLALLAFIAIIAVLILMVFAPKGQARPTLTSERIEENTIL